MTRLSGPNDGAGRMRRYEYLIMPIISDSAGRTA